MNSWVDVEDQLPQCGQTVLVDFGYPDMEVELDYLEICPEDGSVFWANNNDGLIVRWAPIPSRV